jgi:uncharacterized membrane protein YphA (DoxX/SURF4 family)
MRDGRSADVLSWIGTLARLLVGGVFVVAGALKVDDPEASVRAVQAYRLLPTGVAEVVGYTLPAVEIGIGVLLVAFVIGVSSAWARGLSIDCGCFGGGGAVAPGATRYVEELLRNAGLILAAAYLVLRPQTRLSLDRTPGDTEDVPAPEEVAA